MPSEEITRDIHCVTKWSKLDTTWEGVSGFNDDPEFRKKMGGSQDGTPDGPKLHSVIVDPRDPKHLYVGMSGGGVHESRDAGASWKPLIDGMEVVGGFDASLDACEDVEDD